MIPSLYFGFSFFFLTDFVNRKIGLMKMDDSVKEKKHEKDKEDLKHVDSYISRGTSESINAEDNGPLI